MEAVVLSIPRISPYMTVAFENGQVPISAVAERVEEFCRSAAEKGNSHKVLILVPEKLPSTLNALLPESWERITVVDDNGATAFEAVYRATAGTEHILWVDGLSPFWSVGLAHHLYNLHLESWCDYTFADGFPTGFAPEIVRRETIAPLRELALAGNVPWTRTLLFDTLMQDINAFDVETEAAQEDYAILRVSLTVDHRGDYLLCRNAARFLGTEHSRTEGTEGTEQSWSVLFDESAEPILQFLLNQGESHRTVPRYAQVQISTTHSVVPAFALPEDRVLRGTEQNPQNRNSQGGSSAELSPELFGRFLTQLHELSPEATVAIGYRGEPALHSDFAGIITACRNLPEGTFFLETSGVGWTSEQTQLLINSDVFNAVIVEIDANTEQTYMQLRGDHWSEVQRFVETIRSALPGKVYAQATRVQENEWELQDFFRHWSDTPGVTPIIQKYNSIAGILPDRRVSDLSPIRRCPCFHLQRDIVVLADGTVPRCFQDIGGKAVRGSLASQSLEVIWNRGAEEYLSHLREEYPSMCESCDEYYTFNA